MIRPLHNSIWHLRLYNNQNTKKKITGDRLALITMDGNTFPATQHGVDPNLSYVYYAMNGLGGSEGRSLRIRDLIFKGR
jgi:hypothetical protein